MTRLQIILGGGGGGVEGDKVKNDKAQNYFQNKGNSQRQKKCYFFV
jgi:hypothetical protein